MECPKKIHQIFFVINSPLMPEKWSEYHEMWKASHPEYEVVLWSLDMVTELIRELRPEFLPIFEAYPHPIQRVDAARPFILYTHGGVYVDLDTSPRRNITPLLDAYFSAGTGVLLAKNQHNPRWLSNWFMASTQRNKFWTHVIDMMIRRSRSFYPTKHLEIMKTTGPLLLTDAVRSEHSSSVSFVSASLLNSTTVCGKSKASGLMYVHDDHDSSWHSRDSQYLNKLFCATFPLHDLPWYTWLGVVAVTLTALAVVSHKLAECKQHCRL